MLLTVIPSLGRRATAEAVGTGLLVAVVVGSGIAADRLAPDQPGVVLLANAAATAGGLVALILMFAAVSGAHFNPVVTLASRLTGHLDTGNAAAYIGAQLAGGIVGVVVANLMFELAPITLATTERVSSGLWLGEIVATFGLVILILTLTATNRSAAAPYAVAGFIGAGYWFTSSTSFANPAVTVARTLSDTFTGIAPASAPAFIVAQLVGAVVAVGLAYYLHETIPAAATAVDPLAATAPKELPT